MFLGEHLTTKHIIVGIVPVKLGVTIKAVLIQDIGHTYQCRILTGQPAVVHLTVFEIDDHIVATLNGGKEALTFLVILSKRYSLATLIGFEELVPEQRLERIEVQAAVSQEINLAIRRFQVLLIDTVHNEHVILGELKTSGLNKSKGHQLQTNHIVTTHLQITRQRNLLRTNLNRELHL